MHFFRRTPRAQGSSHTSASRSKSGRWRDVGLVAFLVSAAVFVGPWGYGFVAHAIDGTVSGSEPTVITWLGPVAGIASASLLVLAIYGIFRALRQAEADRRLARGVAEVRTGLAELRTGLTSFREGDFGTDHLALIELAREQDGLRRQLASDRESLKVLRTRLAQLENHHSPAPGADDPEVSLAPRGDEVIRGALISGRCEVYLQPIVRLSDRAVFGYEVFSRIRVGGGTVLYKPDLARAAEVGGLASKFDLFILSCALEIMRDVATPATPLGLFCHFFDSSFLDRTFIDALGRVLDGLPKTGASLVGSVSESAVQHISAIERVALKRLASRGMALSLSLQGRGLLNMDGLSQLGCRYAKISADRLAGGARQGGLDIHPADVSDFFARSGLRLIADGIRDDGTLKTLRRFKIGLGQGSLFADPRFVRIERPLAA